MLPVNFRVDPATLKRAQERLKENGIKLPDLMRLAVKAIADGDATAFNDVLVEGGSSSAEDVNGAWLFHKCHELFIYRDGFLVRRSNKGQGVAGERVDISIKDGIRQVLINGNYYPLKDIVWLMFHGEVSGEVIYKNEGLKSDKLEHLKLNPDKRAITQISFHVSEAQRESITRYKMRALIIDAVNNDRRVHGAIEQLIYRAEVFHIVLTDGKGWRAVRSAIYAQKLSENTYCVSIS